MDCHCVACLGSDGQAHRALDRQDEAPRRGVWEHGRAPRGAAHAHADLHRSEPGPGTAGIRLVLERGGDLRGNRDERPRIRLARVPQPQLRNEGVLFVAGIACMVTKRNALGVLMGIELVLNGANVNFVAFGSKLLRGTSLGLDGQLIALFVIVLAAAEAAVALAIALNFYNNHTTVDVDKAENLKG